MSSRRRARVAPLMAASATAFTLASCGADGPDLAVLPPAPAPIEATPLEADGGGDPAAGFVDDANEGSADGDAVAAALPVDGPPRVRVVPLDDLEMEITFATARPGTDGLYVVGKRGRIERLEGLPTAFDVLTGGVAGSIDRVGVLDIVELTSHVVEEGLLGLAFHPRLDLAYVHHSDPDGVSVVAEYAVAADGSFVEGSRREVLRVAQATNHHNGGRLAFGPDGYLYIGLGDGSEHSDLDRVAQALGSPLGKVLRIDPSAGPWGPYRIPDDNPLVGVDGADWRIWAVGLRNPFSFSFDDATGDLWLADVGQGEVEEVNHSPAVDGVDAGRGANYGWSAFEGDQPYNPDQVAPDAEHPTIVYRHDDGRCSVIGAGVVRDATVPLLEGWYLFGDWCSGELWAYRHEPGAVAEWIDLGTVQRFVGVARSDLGDLYAFGASGALSLLVPEG